MNSKLMAIDNEVAINYGNRPLITVTANSVAELIALLEELKATSQPRAKQGDLQYGNYFTVDVNKRLIAHGIYNLDMLCELSFEDLIAIPGITEKNIRQIRSALINAGYQRMGLRSMINKIDKPKSNVNEIKPDVNAKDQVVVQEAFKFQTAILNLLLDHRIYFLHQLTTISELDVLNWYGVSHKKLTTIKSTLAHYGLAMIQPRGKI